MVMGRFRERQYRIEGGSEPRGMIEREDEEGPDEGRWRCLNYRMRIQVFAVEKKKKFPERR
jgi:hypothetical protein